MECFLQKKGATCCWSYQEISHISLPGRIIAAADSINSWQLLNYNIQSLHKTTVLIFPQTLQLAVRIEIFSICPTI